MRVNTSLVTSLKAHNGWVTSITSSKVDLDDNGTSEMFLTSSRDKTVLVWNFNKSLGEAVPSKCLQGHTQCVQDVVLSADSCHAISGSWDATMKLWDLQTGQEIRKFVGHRSDVNSVAFSPDCRQIVSGSRDKEMRMWNVLGESKFVISDQQHTDWISCVRFSPVSTPESLAVSCGWDGMVKVWGLEECKLKCNMEGHLGVVNCVTISPDGSLCASAGRDGAAMLWDIFRGEHLYSLEAHCEISALSFSPSNYWLGAATKDGVKIWDLEKKVLIGEVTDNENTKSLVPWCSSMCWSKDGEYLFIGTTSGEVRIYRTSLEAPLA